MQTRTSERHALSAAERKGSRRVAAYDTVDAGSSTIGITRALEARERSPARRGGMTEVYISTDIETDGPIPGPHSMLSFGSAAFRADKSLLSAFTANLDTLPAATGHPE